MSPRKDRDMRNPSSLFSFKGAFRGYNKKDVNRYIESIHHRFTSEENKYKEKISQLSEAGNQKEELTSRISSLEEQLSIKDAEIEQLKHQLEEAEDAKNTLKEENDKLNSDMENHLSAIESLKGDLYKANETIDATKGDGQNTLTEKAELYDEMSSRLGNMLIMADKNAEKIINDAENEAGKIRNDALIEAERIHKDVSYKSSALFGEISSKLRVMSENYADDYVAIFDEINTGLDNLSRTMKQKIDSVYSNLSNIKADIGDQIEKDFSAYSDKNGFNK